MFSMIYEAVPAFSAALPCFCIVFETETFSQADGLIYVSGLERSPLQVGLRMLELHL